MALRRARDDDGFDAFYAGTAARVVHLVHATTGDYGLAQDVTQEAYARAWQQWAKVSAYDDPLSWVRTVARRLAISQWRSAQAKQRAYTRHGVDDHAGSPTEDHVAVVAALRTLPDAVRETVVLHYITDLSIAQIAEETNTPAGTVKARLHRGRALLAQALAHEESHHG